MSEFIWATLAGAIFGYLVGYLVFMYHYGDQIKN